MTLNEMIKSCEIFKKYLPGEEYFESARDDQVWMAATPTITNEDRDTLVSLGWTRDTEPEPDEVLDEEALEYLNEQPWNHYV